MTAISHRIRRLAKVAAGTDLFVPKEVDVAYTVLGSEYGRWPLVTSQTSETLGHLLLRRRRRYLLRSSRHRSVSLPGLRI